MQNESFFSGNGGFLDGPGVNLPGIGRTVSRERAIGAILVVALLAFEMFNFDTTRYALSNLLGPISFMNIPWAAILAVAFCSIDFAGLAHLFTPQRGADEPREVWYLMGAWLLGAIMNALMTWWAVNVTLLENQFGNEVLTRQQLLQIVPPFVAVLVLLTRVLFIGAFSIAGETFFRPQEEKAPRPMPAREHMTERHTARRPKPQGQPRREHPASREPQGPPIVQPTRPAMSARAAGRRRPAR